MSQNHKGIRSRYMDEDQRWMEQLVKGEKEAFDQLYQKYSGQIYSFFKNRVMDHDLVADIHQSTWERVYKKAHTFDLNQKFSSWLYTIASNILVDEIRRKSRLKKFIEEGLEKNSDRYLGHPSSEGLVDDDRLDQKNINETFSEKDYDPRLNQNLNSKLNELSDLNKKVIEMRYLDEKSFLEISSELNLKESNVRKIVSRVLKKLKGSEL